jgi:hypothetical protein
MSKPRVYKEILTYNDLWPRWVGVNQYGQMGFFNCWKDALNYAVEITIFLKR